MKNTEPIDGLLLAAGTSSRMGAFKPLLTYQSVPFVLLILARMSTVCRRIGLVVGHRRQELLNAINRHLQDPILPSVLQNLGIPAKAFDDLPGKMRAIENPEYAAGMFSSLLRGVQAMSDSPWLLYHFVDQPFLPLAFYRELSQQADDQFDWIQPAFHTRRGHPLLIHHRLFSKLANTGETGTLQQFLKENRIKQKIWECPYPGILKDVDTPTDYRALTSSSD